MNQTPDPLGTPEPSDGPPNPPTTPVEHPAQASPSGPPAQPPPAEQGQPAPPGSPTQPPYAASAQGVPATARPDGRSMWGEATSTRGGTLAVVLAAASLGLVALLLAGLTAVVVAREVTDDRGWWAGDSREMPGPEGMNPGRGPGQGQGQGQGPPGQNRGEGRDGAGDLPGLGLPGAGGVLHGEAVIPGEAGTATRTVVFQRGQVTAVTADKLTVRSTDGFSATYTIGADTRERLARKVSTLATGDEVTVVATKADATTIRILRSGRTGDN